MRDHSPITIDEFNGLWQRGVNAPIAQDAADSVPLDHFSDCNNIQYIESGFETRAGIIGSTQFGVGITNVLKIKNYPKIASESRLILDTDGNIFDDAFGTTPILTIP